MALPLARPGRETWERRIQRARQLSADAPGGELLEFYARLLTFQATVYERLAARARGPAADPERDLALLAPLVEDLGRLVASKGPAPLAAEANGWLERSSSEVSAWLLDWWRVRSDYDFFSKALLQPYAARLADEGGPPLDGGPTRADNRCPFCGGAPQLSILDTPGEIGGGRWLQCATCLTSWPFRRVLCPSCGEEDERRLGYFHADDLDHLRLDVCDTCRRYLKSVDLTRNGLAVPLVDEVAGAPLDVWARERGYEKIELNLVGL